MEGDGEVYTLLGPSEVHWIWKPLEDTVRSFLLKYFPFPSLKLILLRKIRKVSSWQLLSSDGVFSVDYAFAYLLLMSDMQSILFYLHIVNKKETRKRKFENFFIIKILCFEGVWNCFIRNNFLMSKLVISAIVQTWPR